MHNRVFCFLLTLMLSFTIFAFAENDATASIEPPVFDWQRNTANHWQLNESGEVVTQGAHAFDEALLCTVCGSVVMDWGDGSVDLINYDEYGNYTRITSFDADGTITNDIAYALEYNEDGVVLLNREFCNGVLYGETIYTANENGEQIPVTQTAWNDDGTTSVNYYDKHSNCIRSVIFEADGAISVETISEYALNDDGWYYEAKSTTRFATGATFYTESNQYGDPIRTLNVEDDGTAWADYTYEYEYKHGIMVWEKQYTGGRLSAQAWMDEAGNTIRDIHYEEDGSALEETYNANGEVTSISVIRADGSIDRVETFEYEYAEDMSILCTKVYSGDKLIRQTDYLYDDALIMTGSVETTWNQDGSRSVCEYNEWFELVNAVTYDANGNVIN